MTVYLKIKYETNHIETFSEKTKKSIIATSKIELCVALVRKLYFRCCETFISTSGTLCVLEFVQVFKLRKFLELQSANLPKMNFCTSTFRFFWVIALVSPYLIQNNLNYSTISFLQQKKQSTFVPITLYLLHLYYSVMIWFFLDFSSVLEISTSPSKQTLFILKT